ncbi:MAG: pyridine nucleotide-disulfide oxidoreductase [Xanthobacter sp. 35-67-6]|nr:MAG: pyridine nucleotide-disulfide oxidoreductase [Xanthobacter sp. 35-67-6]
MQPNGVDGQLSIDWPELIAFKRTFTDPVPKKRAKTYAEKGIEAFKGKARFTGRNTMKVEDITLEGDHFLIAAGAEPVKLGISGEEYLATHEDFLNLEQLPRRIVLVGGGYIASEFSHIAARAGAAVTILQRGERMLEQFDPDLVGWLMETFKTIGIDVRTKTTVEAVEKSGSVFAVRASSNGKSSVFEADLVVHAAGRAPALELLDLNAAGVTLEKGRLKLNEFLQSVSNPAVYAAGDAAQIGPLLTPVSSHDAKVAIANLLEGNRHTPNYLGVPSVAFTVPPIAAVGLNETQSKAQGLQFDMKSQKVSDWYTARRVAEPVYGYKVLIEKSTGRILGAHLVGPHVDEVINIFALAIRHGLTADDLKTTMFAYPTGASDISSML